MSEALPEISLSSELQLPLYPLGHLSPLLFSDDLLALLAFPLSR